MTYKINYWINENEAVTSIIVEAQTVYRDELNPEIVFADGVLLEFPGDVVSIKRVMTDEC